VLTVIVTKMTITGRYICSTNSEVTITGRFIGSAYSYCDYNGEVYTQC
jgi:hypothetical protein